MGRTEKVEYFGCNWMGSRCAGRAHGRALLPFTILFWWHVPLGCLSGWCHLTPLCTSVVTPCTCHIPVPSLLPICLESDSLLFLGDFLWAAQPWPQPEAHWMAARESHTATTDHKLKTSQWKAALWECVMLLPPNYWLLSHLCINRNFVPCSFPSAGRPAAGMQSYHLWNSIIPQNIRNVWMMSWLSSNQIHLHFHWCYSPQSQTIYILHKIGKLGLQLSFAHPQQMICLAPAISSVGQRQKEFYSDEVT